MEQKKKNLPTESSRNRRSESRPWLRYAGLASEMMATLVIATYVGYKLDQWCKWGWPVFLIIFPLLALALLLWRLIKATGKKDG